jgi:PKD repeat protein
MMAQSGRDFLFWGCLTVAGQDSIWAVGRPNAVDICERCHFPKGWLEERSDPPNVSAMTGADFDGVHCDVCHTMYDPFFETTYSGTREGNNWLNYWDETNASAAPSQAAADATYQEDGLQAQNITLFNGGSFYSQTVPFTTTYTENAAGQYFVSGDSDKRASFSDAEARHQMFYSRYHKSRYFCSTCHDVSNPVLANLAFDGTSPGDGTTILPTETNPAYSYYHVERTFSEFMLSDYGLQGGAPGIGPFATDVFTTSLPNNYIARCQDCHMNDVVGKGADMQNAVVRPTGSTEHPNSGQPLHDMTGGNAWVSYVLASATPGASNYDSVNDQLLNQGVITLTLDLAEGEGIDPEALLAGVDRAKQQLQLAASIEDLSYDSNSGALSFQIQNQTGHKLISGFPEGRRMFVNMEAYSGENLIYEVNPYDHTAGTLKSLGFSYITDTLPAPSPLEAHEVYSDTLVYEMHPASSLTGEDETFHFALATGRYKDNRIPPQGFRIAEAADRLSEPAWQGASAPDYFTTDEYAGGYDAVSMTIPSGADHITVTLYYQTTSREYVEFLRNEINGTGNLTLSSPTPSGEPNAYIIQTDSFFTQLRAWGDTIWQLWEHNMNVPGAAPFLMNQASWASSGTLQASFTAWPTTGIAPLTVVFTNTSTGNYDASLWDFGDGITSTLESPSHIYEMAGVYTVSLAISGLGGTDALTRTNYITVYAPVSAHFTGSPTSGVVPLAVSFTNLSSGDYDVCSWTLGDGGTSLACDDPGHTYTTAGVYTVTLTVSGLGGTDALTRTNYITAYAPVSADFTGSPTSGVAPLAVSFTNLSIGDYDACFWTFGDGDTSAACDDPGHTYTAAGVYTVTLTVSGLGGTDALTRANYITAYTPLTVDFVGSPRSGGAPLTVQFTSTVTGTVTDHLWRFGDGDVAYTPHPTHTYGNAGLFGVTLMITGPTGTANRSKPGYITVSAPPNAPTATISADVTSGTPPLTVTFTAVTSGTIEHWVWDFGDGDQAFAGPVVSHTYTTSGIFDVGLTVSNTHGSFIDSKPGYITVYQPVTADFSGGPTSGTAPLTVSFTNLSTGDYDACSWTFGDGGTSAACDDPGHTYTAAGVYTVTLTVSGLGGTDALTRTNYITTYAPVSADFTGSPTSGVTPLAVSFTNLSTGDYDACSWTFGDGGTSAACDDPGHTYTAAGVYTVTLTVSGLGGTDALTRTNYITAYTPLTVDFVGSPRSGGAPLTVQFTSTVTGTVTDYLWRFGDGGVAHTPHPTHTYHNAGLFGVTLMITGPTGTANRSKPGYITVSTPPNAPTAAISADVTSGTPPLTVTFTAVTSGTVEHWVWDFGDGDQAFTGPVVSHTYTTSGLFDVSLTVSNTHGSFIDSKLDYIAVYQPVTADFSGNPTSGPAPLTVSFTNLSTGDYDVCSWIFGDGGTSPACDDPGHTYTTAGVYTITLTVNGLGGTDALTRPRYITVRQASSIYLPLVVRDNSKTTAIRSPRVGLRLGLTRPHAYPRWRYAKTPNATRFSPTPK